MIRLRTLGALQLLAASLLASAVDAQSTSTNLAGVVTGSDGAPVPAWVEIRSRETGAVRSARAAADGAYRILGLAPGSYDVTARALGFRAERRIGLELLLETAGRADFVLAHEVVALEPTVIVAAPTLEVERLSVSTAVSRREIDALPVNQRNIFALASIAPGVRSYGTEAGRAVPTSGAMSGARFVNFYVDGMEWKSMTTGQVVGLPASGSLLPQDAVRELRVYQNPYDAEFAHGASMVISAVTEQGGNELHGSAFALEQNQALVARSAHEEVKPDYDRRQTGIHLRGPVVRNRMFFAVSYEDQSTQNFVDVVPGRPASDPGIWDRYAGTFPAPLRDRMAVVRLTSLSGPHTIDASWIGRALTTDASFGTQQNGVMLSHEAGITSAYTVQHLALRDRYVSSRFVNELSLRLLRSDQEDDPVRPGTTYRYPGIQLGRMSIPATTRERHVGLSDRISFVGRAFGREHLVKLGLEVTALRGFGYQPTSKDGIFSFASDTSTLPFSAQIGVGYLDPSSTSDAESYRQGWVASAYVQDQWKPLSRLTLAAGARYDADIHTLNQGTLSPWAEDTVLRRVVGDRYINTGDRVNDLNNVAPRVAAAWDVTGHGSTSLRAGYGVMYDRVPTFGAVTEQIAWRWRTYVVPNPGTTDAEVLRQRILAAGSTSAPNLTLLPDRMETPANHQWSVGIGRRFTDRLALDVDYVDQHLTHLPVTVRLNTLNTVTRQRRLTNRYGDLVLWGDFATARFQGVLSSLTYDQGVTRVAVAYTLGWAQSETGALSNSDFPDSASYTMQASEGDERHRVVLSGFTELPRGVKLAAIAIAASPRPYPVIVGTDVNHDNLINDDFPDGSRTGRRTGLEHWYRTVDLRVGKTLPISGGHVVATAELFDAFNWANHSEYRGTQSQPGFGEPIGDYPRRQGQLGLRYEF